MKKAVLVFLASALAIAVAACVEQAPELTAAEREQLRENILSEAPSPTHELDVSFENRVRLIGYDLDTGTGAQGAETVTPGTPFTITWYWHAQRRLDSGWQLFTHLADSRGENRLNQDSEGTVRQLYQPGRWREGEYIRDVQRITLPADWNSDRVIFYLGLWNGPHRLAVSRGPHDEENRARAATLTVSSAPGAAAAPGAGASPAAERPQPPIPAVRAARAEGITIDGRADEPAWQRSASTGSFVDTRSGAPAELRASARMLWDDRKLYVALDIADTTLRNTLRGRDAHLWEQDAIELMIDPEGDGRGYYELQVSPTGEIFDTRYDSRRVPGPIGHSDWNAAIEARVALRGTANDEGADEGYAVELAIPWSSFSDAQGAPLAAPPAGSTWRMNLYAMDWTGTGQRAAGWSPTLEGDFHVPARFGRVVFEGQPLATAVAEASPDLLEATPRIELPEALRRAMERDNPQARALDRRLAPPIQRP